MRRFFPGVLAVAAATLLSLSGAAFAGDLSALYLRYKDSIVTIKGEAPGGVKTGSGFYVAENLIATNCHVIQGARQVRYAVNSKDGWAEALKLAAVDPVRDLALLYVDKPGMPIPLTSPKNITPGAEIGVIGSPVGLEKSVTSGNFSQLRLWKKTVEVLQISAPISPGNSGGPVFDAAGDVVGVATLGSIGQGLQNVNFAVSADYLAAMLLTAQGTPPDQYAAIDSAWGPTEAESAKAIRAWVDKNGVYHATNLPPGEKEKKNAKKSENLQEAPVSFMWRQ